MGGIVANKKCHFGGVVAVENVIRKGSVQYSKIICNNRLYKGKI